MNHIEAHHRIASALLAYDASHSTLATSQIAAYLEALQDGVDNDLARGIDVRTAILGAFSGRLANHILRAIGLRTVDTAEARLLAW